ncbi:MAG: GDP-mannose 4,6-dehydratase [Magnetovibrio sp.]|nr:GDP-mannose 4,6-dehydratase [Magnetovibrio sp.]
MKKALISGISGQDGSYLAELLISKGYEVHGIVRRSSILNINRIDHLLQPGEMHGESLKLYFGDVTDSSRLADLIDRIEPEEVYNLAAQSHVNISFHEPIHTSEVVALGALKMLEAVRKSGASHIRFYQATTSEVFGNAGVSPQDEHTPFHPDNPYACGKVFAFHQVRLYREAYGLHASNGILFNHESPRRGDNFVTRKITRGLARIVAGRQNKLALGNLDARRDWGHAKDYVEAMWMMMQQASSDDYVIATGKSHSVRDFLDASFGLLGLDWSTHVVSDPELLRPVDVNEFIGDSSKARQAFGWEPRISLREMAREMVITDLLHEGIDVAQFGL